MQCDEDWKLKTLQQKVFTSRKKKSMFCCEREIPMEWNPVLDISISLYISGNIFILCLEFFTSGKRNFVDFEVQKEARDHLFCFCFSLFGGKISCHFTGCILQIFSVDVDIDVNTNFYLNTRESGSLFVFLLWLWAVISLCNFHNLVLVTVHISQCIGLTKYHLIQTNSWCCCSKFIGRN